jgi:hypothetical protein
MTTTFGTATLGLHCSSRVKVRTLSMSLERSVWRRSEMSLLTVDIGQVKTSSEILLQNIACALCMSMYSKEGDSVHVSWSVSLEKKSAGLSSLRIYRGTNPLSSRSRPLFDTVRHFIVKQIFSNQSLHQTIRFSTVHPRKRSFSIKNRFLSSKIDFCLQPI